MAVMTLDELLEQCLSDIRAGRATLDECLARHAERRAELEPLLRTAASITLPEIRLDPARRARARVQFVETLHAERQRTATGWRRFLPLPPAGTAGRLSVPAALGVIAALAVATGGGAAYAAQDALPGETLYTVKLAMEQAQIALAANDEARALVQLDIAARRLDEVQKATAVRNEQAAQQAAEGYVTAVAAVTEQVTALEASGKKTEEIASKLAADLEQQQQALAQAAERAPEPAAPALAKAREYASRGLERAKGKAGSDESRSRGRERDSEDAATAPAAAAGAGATPPPAAPAVTPVIAAAGLPTAAPTVEAGGTAAAARGAGDQTDGTAETFAGLKAKLDAAAGMLERGQPETARNQLAAFHNQLEALHRAGRLSDAEYRTLDEAYRAVLRTLGAGGSDDDPGRKGPQQGKDEKDNQDRKDDRGLGADIPPAASGAPPDQQRPDRGHDDDRGKGERGDKDDRGGQESRSGRDQREHDEDRRDSGSSGRDRSKSERRD